MDLRYFINQCEAANELKRVAAEVDWNLEVGAISRRICEIGAPMAHMKKIRGVSNGASILGSPLAKGWNSDFSRIAIGLGEPDVCINEAARRSGWFSETTLREVVAQLVKISRCPTRITGIAGPEKPFEGSGLGSGLMGGGGMPGMPGMGGGMPRGGMPQMPNFGAKPKKQKKWRF